MLCSYEIFSRCFWMVDGDVDPNLLTLSLKFFFTFTLIITTFRTMINKNFPFDLHNSVISTQKEKMKTRNL